VDDPSVTAVAEVVGEGAACSVRSPPEAPEAPEGFELFEASEAPEKQAEVSMTVMMATPTLRPRLLHLDRIVSSVTVVRVIVP